MKYLLISLFAIGCGTSVIPIDGLPLPAVPVPVPVAPVGPVTATPVGCSWNVFAPQHFRGAEPLCASDADGSSPCCRASLGVANAGVLSIDVEGAGGFRLALLVPFAVGSQLVTGDQLVFGVSRFAGTVDLDVDQAVDGPAQWIASIEATSGATILSGTFTGSMP